MLEVKRFSSITSRGWSWRRQNVCCSVSGGCVEGRWSEGSFLYNVGSSPDVIPLVPAVPGLALSIPDSRFLLLRELYWVRLRAQYFVSRRNPWQFEPGTFNDLGLATLPHDNLVRVLSQTLRVYKSPRP